MKRATTTCAALEARLQSLRVLWLWALLGWGAAQPIFAQNGQSWTLRNPLPTQQNLHAAAWSGSRWVTVGDAGLILVSSDGIAWSSRVSGVVAALRGVVHTGSQFVIVGDSGTILTSTDGNTWTRRTTSTPQALRSVLWTGSTLVALGDAGTALTSQTGVVWTTRFTGTSLDLLSGVWTGSKVHAVGELGITLESSTGVTWSLSSQTPALGFTAVTWDGAQLVASTSSGTIQTSSNGLAWTQRFVVPASLSSILWTGTNLVACGSGGAVLTSVDGISWAPQTTGVQQLLSGLAQGAGITLAVGATGALLTSANTVTWTDRSTVSQAPLRDIAWTGLRMATVGLEGAVLTSTDGVVWAVQSSGVSADLHGVVWAGDQLIAVGEGGMILTSTDALSWTPQVSGTGVDLNAIEWTRDLAIAVGAGGVILTSPDGITWTARASGTLSELSGVVWSGSKLVAVGAGGTVCVSQDGGLTWSVSSVPPGSNLNDIAWSGSLFCAVGDGDLILTSPNGTTWTQRNIAFAQNLESVTWVAGRFVAVGTSQLILTSTQGSSWTKQGSSSVNLPTLRGVRAFRGMLLTVGDGGVILTNGNSPTLTPVVNLAATSLTMDEDAGVVNLGVQLTFAPATQVQIPFVLLGTSTVGVDFTVAASPLVFSPGQSLRNLSLSLRDDVQVESTESLTVLLGSPSTALVGTEHRFTLTITDNDEAPVVILQPLSQIVALGEPLTSFMTNALGSPPIGYQWRRNGANLSGATGSAYTLVNATFSQAGRYSVVAKNPTGSDASVEAELAIVDTASSSVQVPVGGTTTLSVMTAGNGLTYQWRKNLLPVGNGGRISGATTSKLIITGTQVADAGAYDCEVTSPGGSLLSGVRTLSVLEPPVVTPGALPGTMIGGSYSHVLTASFFPTRFTAVGLPRGLVLNASTGVISGRAQVSGTFNLLISASNAAGTSPQVLAPLVVQSIPAGAVGNFQAQIARHSLNQDLGGRLELTTTSAGMCSGRLTLGGSSYPFSSRLDTFFGMDPQFSIVIPRAGNPAIEMDVTIDASSQTLVGTVSLGAAPAGVSGWRQVWSTTSLPAQELAGYYTVGLDVQGLSVGDPAVPQGTGYLSCSVGLDGRLTWAGKTADGSAVTSSTFLGPNGQSLMFQTLYANTGSWLGVIQLTPDGLAAFTNNTWSGTVSWLRKPQAPSSRSYQPGFGPLDLTAYGKYLAADNRSVVLGLPTGGSTAALLMASGGVESSTTNPDVAAFTYTSALSVVMPTAGSPNNPGKAALSINKSTGFVSGRFTLSDLSGAVIRKVAFEGMIIRPPTGTRKAFGFFLLPQLPNPATSAILSGQVVVEQP